VGKVMLRLSKLTDYAVVVLVQLADGDAVQTAPCLARSTGIPEPTVAKVLKTLAASRLVASQRGARGGYRLTRPLHDMPIADVITAIDGPIAVAGCIEGVVSSCEAAGLCPVHGRWDRVNDAIHQALLQITLADMARPSGCRGAIDFRLAPAALTAARPAPALAPALSSLDA
jgi:FeS assembly SUF system regulator